MRGCSHAGKGKFVVQWLDLSAQIAELVPLMRSSIPASVQLELRLAKGLPAVESDASQMQQLVMNLVINAGEAIDGHGLVTITTSSRQSDSECQVVLEVKDTGCGIDEQMKTRIFDPFFSSKFTGRGLGLAAVLGIIRSHNGSISVESAPGSGSVFTVALPASAAGATASKGIPARDPQFEMRGDGHVLVVDDEELVRNMARIALERCGYSVETAADGALAVATVAARPAQFDAVLLDLTMPSMGGDQALREIHAIRSDIPVISSGFAKAGMHRFADQLAGFLQNVHSLRARAQGKLAIGPRKH